MGTVPTQCLTQSKTKSRALQDTLSLSDERLETFWEIKEGCRTQQQRPQDRAVQQGEQLGSHVLQSCCQC